MSFVVLFSIKFHQNNLRAVIETEWYDAVSNATADHHACAAVCIQSGIIFGKQPLIGGNQPADKRQPELAIVLEDEAISLERGGETIALLGLADPDFMVKGDMFGEVPAMVSTIPTSV